MPTWPALPRHYRVGGAALVLYFIFLGSLLLQLLSIYPYDVVATEQLPGRRAQLLQGDPADSRTLAWGATADVLAEVQRPLTWDGATVGALLVSLVVSALANSAGVGGGAFFVPLFNVIAGFSVKMSTALSQAVIAGGAVGSTAYSLSRHHLLDRKRPLVDFELALMLTPLLLLGVSAGVLLNVVFPTWAVTLCLVLLLGYLTVRTARTGARLYAVEARLLDLQRALGAPGGGAAAAAAAAAAKEPSSGAVLAPGMVVSSGSSGRGGIWELRGHDLEGEGSEEVAEDRPLLGMGGSTCAATTASSSPPLSQAGSLLSGLSIGLGRLCRAREGGSPFSPFSAFSGSGWGSGRGSLDEGCGSGGGTASSGGGVGLLQREVSMQRVPSALQQAGQPGAGACAGGEHGWLRWQRGGPPGAVWEGQGAEEQGGLIQAGGHDGSHQRSDPRNEQQQLPLHSRPHQPLQHADHLHCKQRLLPPSPAQPQLSPRQSEDVVVRVTSRSPSMPTIKLRPCPSSASQEGLGDPIPCAPPRLALPPLGGSGRGGPSLLPSPRGAGERHGLLSGMEAFQAGIHGGEGDQEQLDERRFPWASLAQLAALWAAFLALQLAKSQLERCSWGFAALYCAQALGSLGASAFFVRQVLLRQWRQQQLGRAAWAELECPILFSTSVSPGSSPTHSTYSPPPKQPLPPGDTSLPRLEPPEQQQQQRGACSPLRRPVSAAAAAGAASKLGGAAPWSARRLLGVLGVVLAGGAIAGLLGIGGGMIVGPLMLELGVHPQVSSATSGLMVLFSASVAAVSFAASGRLNVPYAAVFSGVCLAAAFLGVLVVGRLVKRSGRASLVVLLLAGIMGLGALLTAGYAGSHAISDLIHQQDIGFSPFCAQ